MHGDEYREAAKVRFLTYASIPNLDGYLAQSSRHYVQMNLASGADVLNDHDMLTALGASAAAVFLLVIVLIVALRAASRRSRRRREELDSVSKAVERLNASKARTSKILETTDFVGARSRFLVSVARIPNNVGDPFKEWFDEVLDKVSRAVSYYDDLFNREDIPAKPRFVEDIHALAAEFDSVSDRVTSAATKAEDIITEARRTAARCAPELLVEYMRSVTDRLGGIERRLIDTGRGFPPPPAPSYSAPPPPPPPAASFQRFDEGGEDDSSHDGYVVDADVVDHRG